MADRSVPLTAEQIYNLCKDWPRDAWPRTVEWFELWQEGKCHVRCFNGFGLTCLPDEAVAALFRDSGLRWLMARGVQPLCLEQNHSGKTPSHHPKYLAGHYVLEEHSVGGCAAAYFGADLLFCIVSAIAAISKENGK